jgi:hypothetical protein
MRRTVEAGTGTRNRALAARPPGPGARNRALAARPPGPGARILEG